MTNKNSLPVVFSLSVFNFFFLLLCSILFCISTQRSLCSKEKCAALCTGNVTVLSTGCALGKKKEPKRLRKIIERRFTLSGSRWNRHAWIFTKSVSLWTKIPLSYSFIQLHLRWHLTSTTLTISTRTIFHMSVCVYWTVKKVPLKWMSYILRDLLYEFQTQTGSTARFDF